MEPTQEQVERSERDSLRKQLEEARAERDSARAALAVVADAVLGPHVGWSAPGEDGVMAGIRKIKRERDSARERLADMEYRLGESIMAGECWQEQARQVEEKLEKALAALQAMVTMSDAGPCPKKFDESLSWRDNDLKARAMADEALVAAKGEK